MSACAIVVAISRKPTRVEVGHDDCQLLSDFLLHGLAEHTRYVLGTNSLGGNEASRRHAAKRSSGTGSGSDPFQPAYVSARTSDSTHAE